LASRLGIVSFVGTFNASLGELLEILLGAFAIAAGAVLLASGLGTVVRRFQRGLSRSGGRVLDLAVAGLAGAVVAGILGAIVEWLYQLGDPLTTLVGPALVGAVAGLVIAWRVGGGDTFPLGLVVYNFTRTMLNFLRAIEALIMVIVIAVWVGIGPFAGVLALSLHTVAALGKLFSEDVETISAGPMEAVTATGATRLQMIIYAVVPQIIPTYVSLAMYRWDINVRMSTIIGFAGGGGIGFLLQQNANLLRYREASAQILAIALVVTAMDYLSSYLRAKAV
jgi:phosphonate ABC transporter permease subunit PhnE